jgi:hypothetical protein
MKNIEVFSAVLLRSMTSDVYNRKHCALHS